MNEYEKKIDEFFIKDLRLIKSPKIVEFGVRHGISTKRFIEICEKNDGFLHSVDMDDFSDISDSKYWKFHLSRDDNFDYLDKEIPIDVDLFYLDSFHNAKHIEKIFYHYFPKLKLNGQFLIDDISWIPYLADAKRNNFNCEINNNETFEKILEINYANIENMEVYFSFLGSGSAKIIKKSENEIFPSKSIKTRKFSIKNLFRKLL